MVFCGLFPIDADRYGDLREALGRLQLNDAALQYEPEARSVQREHTAVLAFSSEASGLAAVQPCCSALHVEGPHALHI